MFTLLNRRQRIGKRDRPKIHRSKTGSLVILIRSKRGRVAISLGASTFTTPTSSTTPTLTITKGRRTACFPTKTQWRSWPDSKGFQEAWRKAADKGASLILMSADMTKVIVFDRSKEAAERTPQAVAAAAASIKTYEETKKAAAVKAEKEKEAKDAQLAAVNTPKEQDAGFKIDTKKPDPKTDPKAKKPADPKTPDPAKKKAPEDE